MTPSPGLRKPEMMANKVVLPAPFGPISPVIWPSGADSDAAFTASRPPKRTETRSTLRRTSTMARVPNRRTSGRKPLQSPSLQRRQAANEATGCQPDNKYQHSTIDHQVETRGIAGDEFGTFAERFDHERAYERPEHGAAAADNRRQQ